MSAWVLERGEETALTLEDGERESRGLARTGLGQRNHVFSFERNRYGLDLYWGRLLISEIFTGLAE